MPAREGLGVEEIEDGRSGGHQKGLRDLSQDGGASFEVETEERENTDMDELLPQPDLDDIQNRYWAWYHVPWPPEMSPSD